jgi:phosphoglycolate phosphatase
LSEQPKLLIFDIDGTLMSTGGLTGVAFELAIEELYGVKNSTNGIEPFGLTDQLIFSKILQNNNIPYENGAEEFERFCEKYIIHLGIQLNNSSKPMLLPGVKRLLQKLKDDKKVFLALETGNIEPSAFLKLHSLGVISHFPIGGFGSDSMDRAKIIELAFRRAQAHYRVPFSIKETWVIGDTPNDINAGQQLGINTISVATGVFGVEQLSHHRPNAIFDDFTDWERFLNVIHRQVTEFVPNPGFEPKPEFKPEFKPEIGDNIVSGDKPDSTDIIVDMGYPWDE